MQPPKKKPDHPPVKLVKTGDLRPPGDKGTCLRPLGLCDLGGCCDLCWYNDSNRKTGPSDQPKNPQ